MIDGSMRMLQVILERFGMTEGQAHILAVPQQQRQLLENQDQTNRGQQSLDHAGRKEGGQRSGLEHSQADLDQAAQHDRHQKRFVSSQAGNLSRHDRGESGRGTGNTGVRPAENAHNHSANYSGNQARDRIGVRCNGDAQAQRQRDQEDDDTQASLSTSLGEKRTRS